MILLLGMMAWASDCPEGQTHDVSADDASRYLDEVEDIPLEDLEAFADLRAQVRKATDAMSCLKSVADTSLYARYHRIRVVGLDPTGSLGAKVRAEAQAGLRASKTLDPSGTFSPDFIPPTTGLAAHLAGMDPSDSHELAAPPLDGEIFFDGVKGRQRPADRATFFQRTDGGSVIDNVYLLPGAPVPRYPAVVEADSGGKPFLIVGAATGAAALGLFAANLGVRANALNPDTSSAARASDLQPTVNALAGASVGTAVVSATFFSLSLGMK